MLGRILSVETQIRKISRKNHNPERLILKGTPFSKRTAAFVFFIRIFYEYSETKGEEEIGIADFVPKKIETKGTQGSTAYEPFHQLVHKASQWYAEQRYIRFCNAQTLHLKLKNGRIDTQTFCHRVNKYKKNDYIKILRVVFIKLPEVANVSSPLRLTCKTIYPYRLRKGAFVYKYEKLTAVKERLQKWLQLTGARVFNIETSAIRIKLGECRNEINTNITFHRTCFKAGWIYVFRLYLEGNYEEPSEDLMPPIPVVHNCCTIS
ncbi:uncharacterized protein LOC111637686 isoform X2 [Centruroides sculpturatus]|uniref:uncharacterized protein LOC111637686 isoform X2 n=1 Tax=Centruroides sculpturatus TaxID=218467 RepID=UPI000C6E3A7E|nr:uncharacterized protein LOC111637686 isoform X2 [Centruroides sculpturatus]